VGGEVGGSFVEREGGEVEVEGEGGSVGEEGFCKTRRERNEELGRR